MSIDSREEGDSRESNETRHYRANAERNVLVSDLEKGGWGIVVMRATGGIRGRVRIYSMCVVIKTQDRVPDPCMI